MLYCALRLYWIQDSQFMEEIKPTRRLSTLSLIAITLSAIVSVSGMVIMAQYGTGALFYYALVAIFFLIPSTIVFSELGSAWPQEGGIYNWVKHAFGKHTANVALWSQWLGLIFSFPIMLSFTTSIVLYLIAPNLVSHNDVVLLGSMGLLLFVVILSLYSIKTSALISYITTFTASLIPISVLVILAGFWLGSGRAAATPFHLKQILPHFHDLASFSLIGATVFMFGGMELAANCQKYVKNPKKQYPQAIIISTIIIIVLSVFGTAAISILVPRQHTSLTAGLIQAFSNGAHALHMPWLPYAMGACVGLGEIGIMVVYIMSLSKGLQASVHDGLLPPVLAKESRQGVPYLLVLMLSAVAALVSLLFLLLPSVGAAYWLIEAIVAVGTTLRYLIVFAGAIYLRYKAPDVPRIIRVPGGNLGMWLISGAAFLMCAFAITMTFVPPDEFNIGNPVVFDTILGIGTALFITLPIICGYWSKRWKKQITLSRATLL